MSKENGYVPEGNFKWITPKDLAFEGISRIISKYHEIDTLTGRTNGLEVARALFGEKYLNEYQLSKTNERNGTK